MSFSRAEPSAYGGSQVRGPIGAVAPGLLHSHSNTGSEPESATYTTAHGNAGSLTHWARPRMEPATSGFINHWAMMGTPHIFIYAFPYGLSQDIDYSSLCYTVGPCYLLILYTVVSIHSPQTPSPFFSHFPSPWQPQVCSLCLWVCFCFTDKFICVIF